MIIKCPKIKFINLDIILMQKDYLFIIYFLINLFIDINYFNYICYYFNYKSLLKINYLILLIFYKFPN